MDSTVLLRKLERGEKAQEETRVCNKKEALEWEREFLKSTSANMEMMLGAFVDVYFQDKAGELKERTIKNKQYMIEAHVLPYFANKRMKDLSGQLGKLGQKWWF